jgi:hypothetical protein
MSTDGSLAPIVPRKTVWVVGGMAAAFLIAGAISMWRSIVDRGQWQPIDARIGYSEVISFGDPAKLKYRLQVQFIYEVGREQYNVPVSLPASYLDRNSVMEDAVRYRPGSTYPIYYDAAQPYSILLDRVSAKRFFVEPLLLTAVGVLLGGGLLIAHLRTAPYSCVACGAGVEASHAFCFYCGSRIPARKGKMMA